MELDPPDQLARRCGVRYDKLHTFDVRLGDDADFMESRAVAPGSGAVVASIGDIGLGLAICYDVRFG